jgi:acetolactate synthase-1/2/3 large subunit
MVRLKPDVAIVSDAALGTSALSAALARLDQKRSPQSEAFTAMKQRAQAAIQSVTPQMPFINVMRAVLPRDGFYCEEISQVGFTSRFGFPVYRPRQYVTCGYQDNLGFGFNTALGVKVANPDQPVVAVSGDGGFLFGVQELATAVQYGINLVTVVFNNSSFGNVRRDQVERYGSRFLGAELRNPDFVKLADSFGALALRADTPGELQVALEKALAAGRPAVIEVRSATGGETSPWSFIHPAAP